MSVEELWNKLKTAVGCKSLLKKHLTEERYKTLKGKKTAFGGTLADCIRSGKCFCDISSFTRIPNEDHSHSAIIDYFVIECPCRLEMCISEDIL